MNYKAKSDAILPTIIVIFGITGDLSRRKLLSALWYLYNKGMLPKQFCIMGFSRRNLSVADLQKLVRSALGTGIISANKVQVQKFLDIFLYQQGDFDNIEDYRTLGKRIDNIEQNFGMRANRLFYLSVSPVHYEKIFQSLHDSLIVKSYCEKGKVWTHILVEKPFGRDTRTARILDEKLIEFFCEEEIYRIDHYLAKETVQNILSFRFSNPIFKSVWNREGIKKVHIELLETLGMEGRGVFYSDTGALRDVGQNHLLQLLAMVTMENPKKFDASHIRVKRSEILKRLLPMQDIAHNAVRGQYDDFVYEPGVTERSDAETYFKIRTFLDDPLWEGVPFILESGKRMDKNRTRITVYFRDMQQLPYPVTDKEKCHNTLTFEIKPEEGIEVSFLAKKQGFTHMLEQRTLHFSYHDNTTNDGLYAYERVLYDSIRGDQTLFTSTEEVHAAWRYITPILESWNKIPLEIYTSGTCGPDSRTSLDVDNT